MSPEQLQVEQLHVENHCPVCACSIDEKPVLCPRCHAAHHEDCWEYNEGCAVFGCKPSTCQLPEIIVKEQKIGVIDVYNEVILAARAIPVWPLLVSGLSGVITGLVGIGLTKGFIIKYWFLSPPSEAESMSAIFLAFGVFFLALTALHIFLRSPFLRPSNNVTVLEHSTKDVEGLLYASPKNVNLMEELALRHISEGNLKRSAELLEQAVALEPLRQILWVRLGLVRRRLGNFPGAVLASVRAVAIDSESNAVTKVTEWLSDVGCPSRDVEASTSDYLEQTRLWLADQERAFNDTEAIEAVAA